MGQRYGGPRGAPGVIGVVNIKRPISPEPYIAESSVIYQWKGQSALYNIQQVSLTQYVNENRLLY